jgi:hypothetical protein
MLKCEQCQERLLDYVYGLLEDDFEQTREHLQSCATCRTMLADVQADQAILARAARAITGVPEYKIPADEAPTLPQINVPAPAAKMPATAPTPPPAQSFWRRPAVAYVTAAAVLLAVAAGFTWHHTRSTAHQTQVASARRALDEIDEKYKALPAYYAEQQKTALQKLQPAGTPHLHVVGPTLLQPNAKAHVQVMTRNPAGEPAPAHVRLRLIEVQSGNVVQVTRLQTDRDGQANVEIDASKARPSSMLHVIVDAEMGGQQAAVKESIRVMPPTYVTRIDTNKVVYQVGDVLFFRTLVLDRYSLQPPVQPILLRVELKDPADKVVARLDLATSEGGILAKEFPIAEAFLAGNYSLTVTPRDPAQTLVQSASHKLEVVRDLRMPDIELDENRRYLPGETITGVVRGPMPERVMGKFGNQPPVPVNVEPEGGGGFSRSGGGPIEIGPKKKGAAKSVQPSAAPPTLQRFSAQLPKELPPGQRFVPFSLEFQNGDKKQEYRGVVPVETADYAVDFFPEGGDLVAGVSNRVYYRVRSQTGEPVTSDGTVILLGSTDVIDSRYQLGLGYFDFTPNAKDTYSVRITAPGKTTEISDPFVKLPIRPTGVVLQVPTAVGKQGEPIRVTLRNQGPARKMLLAAHCRGQIVDQRWVDVKPGSQEFSLQPSSDARGMVKVTAYEVGTPPPDAKDDPVPEGVRVADALLPVAERLAYRVPVQRLELGVSMNLRQPETGKAVNLRFDARTEMGDAASAWLLASVVDDRFQSRSRSLSAHFMLLNEIRTGSELEDAQVILHDSPASAQMLERFLGTHGWRRFLPAADPAQAVLNPKAKGPMVFSRESVRPEAQMDAEEAQIAKALLPIRTDAFAKEDVLRNERITASGALQVAEHNKQAFEDAVQFSIRGGLGLFGVVLVAVSLGLMIYGMVRLIRQNKSATPLFAGAFCCMAVCLAVAFLVQTFSPMNAGKNDAKQLADGAPVRDILRKALENPPQVPAPRHVAGAEPVGSYEIAKGKLTGLVDMQANDGKKAADDVKMAALALQEKMARAFVIRDQSESADRLRSNLGNTNLEFFQSRAASTLTPKTAADGKQEPDPKKSPDPIPPQAKNDGKPAMAKENNQQDRIEYAHKHVPNLFADTLLWHPSLLAVKGQAEVRFEIASGQASYRVLVLGHTPSGRFGFYETTLDVLATGR